MRLPMHLSWGPFGFAGHSLAVASLGGLSAIARPVFLALVFFGLVSFALIAPPQSASAQVFQVQSRTMGDLYGHMRSDNTQILRRRIHERLSLNAYDLTGDGSNQVYFASSFRFSHDFGIEQFDLDANPSLSTYDLALLFAYVEARDLFGGLDIKVGRQYEIDAIDMILYDGVRLRYRTPWYFGVEALAGFEARNRLGPVSTNQAELDGVLERQVLSDGQSVRGTKPRLVFGAGVFLDGLTYTQLDVVFRRIQTIDGSGDVNQQRIGGAFSQRIIEGLHINAGASYDFYLSLVNEIRGGLRWRPLHLFEIEANYDYLLPVFDSDSIFAFFSWRPTNRVQERMRFFFDDDLWIHVGAYQSFYTADDTATPLSVDGRVEDLGFSGGGRWIVDSRASVNAEFTTQHGYGGDQTFVDVGGSYWFLTDVLEADLRVLMAIFEDGENSNLEGAMFGAQLGGTWRFSDKGQFRVMVEHATTALQPSWVRVFAVVDFDAAFQ